MTFSPKQLRVTFQLGTGQFGDGGSNTLVVSGLRTECQIVKKGGAGMGGMNMVIFGLTLSQMNTLSTLGMTYTLQRRNLVKVEAGDEGGPLSVVFQGTIKDGYGDFNAQPEVGFHVNAAVGGWESVMPSTPTSVHGAADVSTTMQGLATKMGLSFEGNGVSVKISNPYLHGSYRDQAMALAKHAGVEWLIDNGTLAIWTGDKQRCSSKEPPVIAPPTMKGYPTFTSDGIMVETIFNPSVVYGANITVQSQLTPACGKWLVKTLEYDLACLMPHGPWFSRIGCTRPGNMVL